MRIIAKDSSGKKYLYQIPFTHFLIPNDRHLSSI